MGVCGILARLSAVLVAVLSILVGALIADVPGKLGVWRYLDSFTFYQGVIPLIHEGPWGFNHTSLSSRALEGQTFLVTGANAGLGYGTVHFLAVHGGRVILGCRSMKNCEEAVRKVKKDAPNADLIPLELNLASFASIKKFSNSVHQKTDKLHSLILNAGISRWPYELTEDGFEQHIGVNHLGHVYLEQLVEDLLKHTATKNSPATIVVVSSGMHSRSYPEGVRLSLAALNDPKTYDEGMAYGQSKLANVLYAQELAKRLKSDNILVNSINPGLVQTNIGDHIFERFEQDHPTLTNILVRSGITGALKRLLSVTIWNPMNAALTQVYTAVSPTLLARGTTGKYFNPIARECPADPLHTTNTTLQTRFWDLTQELVRSKENR